MNTSPLRNLLRFEFVAAILLVAVYYSYNATVGALSRHMLLHILIMALLAPLAAVFLLRWTAIKPFFCRRRVLWIATISQLMVFLGWHSPPGMGFAMATDAGMMTMAATLGLAAGTFWLAILSQPRNNIWHAAVALLATGKAFCLIALLLVFSPRVLYAYSGVSLHAALGDQQFAGLLMVTACPLTYIVAAIVIIARWFRQLAVKSMPSPDGAS